MAVVEFRRKVLENHLRPAEGSFSQQPGVTEGTAPRRKGTGKVDHGPGNGVPGEALCQGNSTSPRTVGSEGEGQVPRPLACDLRGLWEKLWGRGREERRTTLPGPESQVTQQLPHPQGGSLQERVASTLPSAFRTSKAHPSVALEAESLTPRCCASHRLGPPRVS